MAIKAIELNGKLSEAFNNVNPSLDMSLFHFTQISLPFEKALWEYAHMEEKAFEVLLEKLPKHGDITKGPDFLNVEFEALFNIPVDNSHQELNQVIQLERSSSVLSTGVIIHINTFLTEKALESLSEITIPPFSFNVISMPLPPPPNVELPPPIPPPQAGLPSTPTILVNSAFTGGLNTEVLLNTQPSVQFGGNIFSLGASTGAANAFFASPARSGSTENRTVPGEAILTTPEGNTFTFYTANVAGHFAGDFVYVLNHPILTPPQAFTIISGNRVFTDKFTYSVTNAQTLTNVGQINVQIVDDTPVATNQSAPSTIAEANIPFIGTNQQTTPNTLSGTLIVPSTPGNLSDNRFGANGGTVSNVTVAGGGTVITPTTITVQDVETNTLVVDTATGNYTYTLSAPFHNVNNQPFNEVFIYTFTDNEGQTSSASLTITSLDDIPVAKPVTATAVFESGLPGGSNPGVQPTTSSGNIIGTNGNLFGADNGTVTNATIPGGSTSIVGGVITATDSAGNPMVIQPSGSYLFTLMNPVVNINHQPLNEVFTFTLTDGDGSTSSSTLTVAVNDDAPNAQPVTASSVFESGLTTGTNPGGQPITSTGNIIGTNGNSFGIHGGTVTNVTSAVGSTVNVGGTFTTTDSVGNTMVIHPNGSYSFTLNHNVTNVNSQPLDEVFTFTLTDTTGSTSSSTVTIGINDDIPIAANITASSVFESALPGGTNPGANPLTASGVIMGTNGNIFGADGGTITSVTIPGGSTSSSAGVITTKDSVGNTLTVNSTTGSFSFTLSHAVTNSFNAPLHEPYTFVLTDGDGSTSSAILSMVINDDIPVSNPETLPGPPAIGDSINGNFFTITGNKSGADGYQDVAVIPFNGSSSTVGNVTTFTDPWGNTLVVNTVTAAFTFTWHANIPGNVTSYNYVLVDNDNSTSESLLTITGLPPVILDLTGNGIHLLSPEQSSMTFDNIFHNGDLRKIGWIREGEGLLMLNTNHDGSLTHVDQIAFVSYLPGAKTDLEGLAAFDTNHDNKLDEQDNDFAKFGVLLANGAFQSLSELGIASISLISDRQPKISNDNIIFGFSYYEKNDGKQYAVADVMLTVGANDKKLNDQDVLIENNEIDFSRFSVMTKDDQVWVKDNDVIIQNELIIESLSPQVLTNILMNDHQQTMQGMMLHHQLELAPV